MPDYAAQRLNMIESQVRANDVTDVRVQEAMREVPRERFVPAARRAIAYADSALELVPGRFLLEPRSFAKLLQLAEIELRQHCVPSLFTTRTAVIKGYRGS